jgi:N-acetylneuraminic acid mutarotase
MKIIRYAFCIFIIVTTSSCFAQWTKKTNYPGGVTDEAVAFAIGDSVYIGGGSSGSTSFYKFDPSSGLWTKKGNITQRSAGVSFAIGSKGYAGLGQSPANSQANVTNDLWEYDPTNDKWTQQANFPGIRRDAAVAFVVGNLAYVGGGYDSSANNIFSDFYSFDPSTNTWDTLNDLPDYVAFGTTFTIGNYGYLTAYAGSSAESSSLWQYDPSSDSWTTLADFPGAPRESAVGYALNGVGYVGLGQSQYDTTFNDFYSYDTSADEWTPVTTFPSSHGLGWAAGVATPTTAFVGLGTYFSGSNLVANNDFWSFAPSSAVSATSLAGNVELYPNPTIDFVNIEIPNNKIPASISVRNEIGVLCLTEQLNEDGRLNLSSLPAGIYNIEIVSGDYHTSQRVVKE